MTTKTQEKAKKIHGRWIMKKMSTTFSDGREEIHEGAQGQLVYDKKTGTVFADIHRDDPKDPSGALSFRYLANFAFSVTNDQEITHNIKAASHYDMIGKTMPREFNLSSDGEYLTITGPSAKYEDAKIHIQWKKDSSYPIMQDRVAGCRM